MRTAQDFIRAIESAGKRWGADMPVKFDLEPDEFDTVQKVVDLLPEGWRCFSADHMHPGAKLMKRALFCGPEYEQPAPVEVAEVQSRKGETETDAFRRVKRTLEDKYGWKFFLELFTRHTSEGQKNIIEVWNPSDYLAHKFPGFSPAEIPGTLFAVASEYRAAKRGQAMLSRALSEWVRHEIEVVVDAQEKLTDSEAELFALVITRTGETEYGEPKYLPLRKIALQLGVSLAMVQKRLNTLKEKHPRIEKFIRNKAIRKPRGTVKARCTKPRKMHP